MRIAIVGICIGVTASSYYRASKGEWFGTGLALGNAYYHFGRLGRLAMSAEKGHTMAVKTFSWSPNARYYCGLVDGRPDQDNLKTEVCGLSFDNPIGIAAGFDKHAEVRTIDIYVYLSLSIYRYPFLSVSLSFVLE
jgi:hypothetical protein